MKQIKCTHHAFRSMLLMLLMLLPLSLYAQGITVSGKVVGTNKEPLAGVTVRVMGTARGMYTNVKGEFKLENVAKDAVLRFTYAGMEEQQERVNGRTIINVVLKEYSTVLDQVVVTGYSTQKRAQMTTSVSKLDTKVLESAPRSNAATALQGTIPGLKVTQNTGQPGSTPSMVLRGGTSFDGSGAPLILVDGVPSSFYALNSDDIESMEVLKDAASTAIYGARAANGVILVTTKKGKAGRSSIVFRTKYTFNNRPIDPMTYLSAEDYVRFNRLAIKDTQIVRNDPNVFSAFLNGSNGAGVGNNATNSIYTTMYLTPQNEHLLGKGTWTSIEDPLDPTKKLIFQANNHSQLFYQNSYAQDYTLSFDGGNDKATYYLSLGLLDDKGLVVGSGFKRVSGTFNGSYKITDRIKVSSSVAYAHSNLNNPYTGIYDLFQRSAGMAPTTRIWYTNPDGTDSDKPHPGTSYNFGNPLYYHDKFPATNLEQRLSANVQLDYNLTDKITLTAKGSHFTVNDSDESFNKAYLEGGTLRTDRTSSVGHSRLLRNQFTALANYRDRFLDKHNVAALLGSEYFINSGFAFNASTRLSPTDLIHTMNAGAEASGKPSSSKTEYAIASIFGQVNYDYDFRYLFGFTFRYDGTSRLGTNKYGFFPGVSVGWNLHNEQFFRENESLVRYLSRVKPRLSYGVNGNIDVLGNYTVQGLYSLTNTYNSEKGYVNTALPNLGLRWERSTTLNAGLDLGLFNNRITLIGDFFIRDVMDKLADQTLPIWTGFSGIKTNNGTLQNRGIELQINAEAIKTKDFKWNINANFASVKSYAKSLPNNGLDKNRQGGREIWSPNDPTKTIYVGGLQEGERLGYDLVTAYVFDGVYKTQAELDEHKDRRVEFAYNKTKRFLGDTRWKDLNGDNIIDSRDRVVVGRTTPWLVGGLSTDLNYKGFSLYVKTDFAVGHYLVNGRRMKGLAQTQGNQNGPVEIKDTWSPTNPDSNIPRYGFTDPQKNHLAAGSDQGDFVNSSTRTLEKGDYLALREVTLSYTLGKPIFNKLIKDARFYITGANLHYFTKYSGSIPEEARGSDTGRYPLPKTFTLGLNLTF